MKLSELKVGMLVRDPSWETDAEIRFIENGQVVARVNAGANSNYFFVFNPDVLIEVKPKKLPSERIDEIYRDLPRQMDTSAALKYSISKYLDEKERESEVR